jgi:peptidoglycan/LPS O-acetylase OafA/YrhL
MESLIMNPVLIWLLISLIGSAALLIARTRGRLKWYIPTLTHLVVGMMSAGMVTIYANEMVFDVLWSLAFCAGACMFSAIGTYIFFNEHCLDSQNVTSAKNN